MELLTMSELAELTGLDREHLCTLIQEFNRYLPLTVSEAMLQNEICPRADLAMISMLSELGAAGCCSGEQLHAICRRVADSRSRRKQMVATGSSHDTEATSVIIEKLDRLLDHNLELRKDSENLRSASEKLCRENTEVRNALAGILDERRRLSELLKKKEEKAQSQYRRTTQLAEIVLKMKQENQDLRSCITSLEKKQNGSDQSKNQSGIESKISELEPRHNNLLELLESKVNCNPSSMSGFFRRMWQRFTQPVYEDQLRL
ncbi:MAG: hypothetical protein PHQ23_14735 [Candidatus Wallbacteria bacterium]|nr:hypothetical protein [Candidatus Wallbacteria bacterium]